MPIIFRFQTISKLLSVGMRVQQKQGVSCCQRCFSDRLRGNWNRDWMTDETTLLFSRQHLKCESGNGFKLPAMNLWTENSEWAP